MPPELRDALAKLFELADLSQYRHGCTSLSHNLLKVCSVTRCPQKRQAAHPDGPSVLPTFAI